MATGEIDKLQLDINVNLSNSAINKINSLSNAIDNLLSKDFSGLSKIATSFSSLNTALSGVRTNGISNLSKKIGELNTSVAGLDSTAFTRKFGEMTTAVTPFIDKINSAKESLQALNRLIDKTGRANDKALGGDDKATSGKSDRSFKKTYSMFSKGINVSALIAKLYVVRNVVRAIARVISNAIERGIQFTETLNLWQTAMRNNVGVARTFISDMNKAYGIAEATLMKYQATFKNMLSALGSIAENSAYQISESLTQMALDFSSLYNTTIDEAMNKFQAVLSGQVRPIRSISGYDITENTIYALYESLGGRKSMRQLDQTEKRLLRILAVFQQMGDTGALGDLSKTLHTNANQLRIMKEQAAEISTWFGNAISHLVQEEGLLVKINSYLFAIKEVAKSIAYELGYSEENFISGIFDDATEANEAVEKLQGSLYGFDKFQVAGEAQSKDISVESIITEALKGYKSALKDVVNPAQRASETILEKFGFKLQEIVDEETGATVQVWRWGDGVESLVDKLKEVWNSLKGIGLLILAIKSPVAAVLTLVETQYLKNADFRKQVNEVLIAVGKALGQIGAKISDLVVKLLPKLQPIIIKTVDLVSELLPIIDDLMPLVETILDLVAELLPPVLSIVSSIIPFVRQIVQKLMPPLVNLIKSLQPIIITILNLVAELLPPIVEVLNPIIERLALTIDLLATIVDWLGKAFNFVVQIGSQDFGWLDNIKIALENIALFLNTINGVIKTLKALLKGILTGEWADFKEEVGNIWEDIGDKWASSLNKFVGRLSNAGKKVIDWFGKLGSKLGNLFSGIGYVPVSPYAEGGFPRKGTMFYAGEAGAEIVANMGGGQSGVMNMEQLTNAITRGMIVANSVSSKDQPITLNVNVGNDNWFNITRNVARQNGYDLVKL